jgi:hypothetical protein
MITKYVRIQTRYSGKTGKPVGIFGACWHLQRAGKLNDAEIDLFRSIDNWFIDNLPEPPFYKDGNPDKAVTWFKRDTTEKMMEELKPLMELLDKNKVEYDIVLTNFPGKIIYEDEYQVATV